MSEDLGYRLWDFLRNAGGCSSIDELDARFHNLLTPHGVTSSGVAVINRPHQMIQDGFGLIHEEWSQIYMSHNYLPFDPIFRSAAYRGTSGYWKNHLDGMIVSTKGDQVMADARTFGICDGYTKFMSSSDSGGVFLLCLQGELLDDSPEAELMIETASQRYINIALALLSRPLTEVVNPDILLTKQQRKVIELLSQGFSQKEVAVKLGISPRTVEKHVKDLKERLGAQNGWEAMRIAYEYGLIA